MKLSTETKQRIIDLIDGELKASVYEGLTEEKRKQLGQVYTPGKICIQMIEKFETVDTLSGQTILDPCCGSGNLLIACLIAGADVDKLFGNDYDEIAVELCKKRLNQVCDILGKPHIQDWQIHQGNALHKFAVTFFGEDYNEMYFDGCTQKAARNKRLNNEDYDAYLMSDRFKKKYPTEYKEMLEKTMIKTAEKQSEQSNTFNLWG
jgi:SAM-dependent methyltransferase